MHSETMGEKKDTQVHRAVDWTLGWHPHLVKIQLSWSSGRSLNKGKGY